MEPYNDTGYIIRVSESVLIQMCLNGLEAYSIAHKGDKYNKAGIETFGLVWGHEIKLPNHRTLYCAELLSIDTSAKRDSDSCDPEASSLELKKDILTSFWPQYDFLGDLHTHPCETYQEVEREKLYEFSPQDVYSIENRPSFAKKNNYRVGLVLTIARLRKKSSRDHRWLNSNTLEFTLGNYRLWLKGYIAFLDRKKVKLTDHEDRNVVLDCPSLVGLVGEYVSFGHCEENRAFKRHVPGVI